MLCRTRITPCQMDDHGMWNPKRTAITVELLDSGSGNCARFHRDLRYSVFWRWWWVFSTVDCSDLADTGCNASRLRHGGLDTTHQLYPEWVRGTKRTLLYTTDLVKLQHSRGVSVPDGSTGLSVPVVQCMKPCFFIMYESMIIRWPRFCCSALTWTY